MVNTLTACRVRQIYYNKLHEARLDQGFVPFFNATTNKFLENQVLIELWERGDHLNSEYYGVLSWKFGKKANKDSWWISKGMDANPGYDVYTFFGTWKHKNVWVVGDNWHENFSKIGRLLFEKLGYDVDVTLLNTPSIYMNYWIIRSELFDKYCTNILLPAMDILKTDKELIELCEKDAKYVNHNIMNKEGCMKIFGKPYYTYYPFVLERCMATFVALEKLTYKHI